MPPLQFRAVDCSSTALVQPLFAHLSLEGIQLRCFAGTNTAEKPEKRAKVPALLSMCGKIQRSSSRAFPFLLRRLTGRLADRGVCAKSCRLWKCMSNKSTETCSDRWKSRDHVPSEKRTSRLVIAWKRPDQPLPAHDSDTIPVCFCYCPERMGSKAIEDYLARLHDDLVSSRAHKVRHTSTSCVAT